MVSLHGRTRLKGSDQAHAQSQNKIGHVGLPYKVVNDSLTCAF